MAQPSRVLNDRYEVDKPLGRGGMAQVFRGTDRVLGRTVAIKVLDQKHRDDAKFVTRFRREAQAAAGINHPNVVSVFDTGSENGLHYIVMEYVDGETLDDVLAREKVLPPERVVAIAEPVARALDAAHQKGMVHRDVKPGNIMLDRSGTVKVVDFGIARAAADDTLTQTGIVLGTAAYLSPEQAQGVAVDPRSDVYSLGCVLYEMLTGRKPFTGDSALAIAYKHVREDPAPPSQVNPDIPPELEAVVMTAMAKDQAQRFPSGGAMQEALSAAATGEMPAMAVVGAGATEPLPGSGDTAVMTTQEAGPEPPPERPPRWWLPWLVIGVILLALVVLGFLAFGGDEPRQAGGGGPGQTEAPPETTPPEETADPVADAYTGLMATLTDGVAAGEVSEKAAEEIRKDADEAVAAFGAGDGEKAAQEMAEAYAKTLEAFDKGEITSEERVAAIQSALQELAAAMGVTISVPEPPEEGEGDGDEEGNGDGSSGRGNSEGKGKEKGRGEGNSEGDD
jgi:tRNA A-37 threonylcarbamoyl transferase component Bud32